MFGEARESMKSLGPRMAGIWLGLEKVRSTTGEEDLNFQCPDGISSPWRGDENDKRDKGETVVDPAPRRDLRLVALVAEEAVAVNNLLGTSLSNLNQRHLSYVVTEDGRLGLC